MNTSKTLVLLLIVFFTVSIQSCSTSEGSEQKSESEEVASEIEEMTEPELWHIHEDGFGEVYLRAVKEMDHEGEKIKKMEPISHGVFVEKIEAHPIEPTPHEIHIAEMVVPIQETETLVAYNEKGKQKGVVQVIHDSQTGEIINVAFMDKHHKDEYDFSTGMTAKEVK